MKKWSTNCGMVGESWLLSKQGEFTSQSLLQLNLQDVYSKPHPFISLLVSPKGKKLLARDAHILGAKRMLTMLTLLVACFSQLDVVKDASVLYDASEATDLFLATVMQTMMLVVAKINLTPISGLLELLLKHNDILAMSHTRVSSSIKVAKLFLT